MPFYGGYGQLHGVTFVSDDTFFPEFDRKAVNHCAIGEDIVFFAGNRDDKAMAAERSAQRTVEPGGLHARLGRGDSKPLYRCQRERESSIV